MRSYSPNDKLYALLDFTGEISGISGFTKYLYCQMGKHACGHDYTFVGQARLARICDCSVKSVQRGIKRIAARGLLQIECEGKFRRYYFVIPDELLALAVKCRIIGDKLSREISAKLQNAVPAAPSTESSVNAAISTSSAAGMANNAATTGDNLSAINKIKNNTNTPLTPRSDDQHRSPRQNPGGGDSSNSYLEKKESISADFKRLAAAYPCQQGLREAFAIYQRHYDELPPIGELLACVEHEKRTNDKWQRDAGRWVTHLKNWLMRKEYQTAMDFLAVAASLREQRQAAKAVNPQVLPESGKQQIDSNENTPKPTIQFVAAEFERCHELWGDSPNKFEKMAARGMWLAQLGRGLLPNFTDAMASVANFKSCCDWLKAFGRNETALCGAC